MTRLGQTIHIRSSGGWHGLSMVFAAGNTLITSAEVVAWDTVLADSDGIQSTVTYSGAGPTVPVGSAGIVPSGMAGLWRVGGRAHFSLGDGLPGTYQFNIIVNNFDPYLSAFYQPDPSDTAAASFDLPISPVVFELAEGDVVWAMVQSDTGGQIDYGLSPDYGMTFLMEFVG